MSQVDEDLRSWGRAISKIGTVGTAWFALVVLAGCSPDADSAPKHARPSAPGASELTGREELIAERLRDWKAITNV